MNIASLLRDQAEQRPSKKAVVFPQKSLKGNYTYKHLTFSELEDLSNFYAFIFKKEGLKIGHKVLLFVRPSLDFPALTFALYKIGAIPILIDPGMGKKNLLNSISKTDSWENISASNPLIQFNNAETSTLGGSFTNIGKSNQLTGTLLAMEIDQTSEVLETYNAVLILKMVERDEFSDSLYQSQYTTIREQLLNNERSRGYSNWLTEAKKLAFEDRAKYYSDPDFNNLSLAVLDSKLVSKLILFFIRT